LIVEAAALTAKAIPLLERDSANSRQLNELTEQVTKLEERSDVLYDRGLKRLFEQHGRSDAMDHRRAFLFRGGDRVGREATAGADSRLCAGLP
jgi:uncharacterized protein Yka (UPF0111/DUF47 family)